MYLEQMRADWRHRTAVAHRRLKSAHRAVALDKAVDSDCVAAPGSTAVPGEIVDKPSDIVETGTGPASTGRMPQPRHNRGPAAAGMAPGRSRLAEALKLLVEV
jgi:hypothetical protein